MYALQNGSGSDEVDDDWAEPVEDSTNQVSAQIGKLIISKDLEKPVEERLDMLHQYFMKAKKESTLQVGICFLFFSFFFFFVVVVVETRLNHILYLKALNGIRSFFHFSG